MSNIYLSTQMTPNAAKKKAPPELLLQVNGIPISAVKVRRKLVSGVPIGELEVIIQDPIIGWIPLDDTFKIEVLKNPKTGWVTATVKDLIPLLEAEASIG